MSNVYHDINSRQDFPNPADEVGGVENTTDHPDAHDYFAATVECVQIGRDEVTSLSDVPDHVFDVVWHMDLNKSLCESGVVAPWITDPTETEEKTIDGYEVYDVLSGNPQDTNPEIALEFKDDVPGEVTFTVGGSLADGGEITTLTGFNGVNGSATHDGSDNSKKQAKSIALAAIAKHVSVDSNGDLAYSPDETDVQLTRAVVAVTSAGVTNAMNTQVSELYAFLANLKKNDVGDNWYSKDNGSGAAHNKLSAQEQVKYGLAQLFDKNAQQNNLILGKEESITRLDVSKIKSRMANEFGADFTEAKSTTAIADNILDYPNADGYKDSETHFFHKFFSLQQLAEVLDAVHDKGSRIELTHSYIAGKTYKVDDYNIFTAFPTGAVRNPSNNDTFKSATTSANPLPDGLSYDSSTEIFMVTGATLFTSFPADATDITYSNATPANGDTFTLDDTAINTLKDAGDYNACESALPITNSGLTFSNDGTTFIDSLPATGKRYKFTQGDTITAVVRICDTDSGYSDNNQHNNSDRWLITLHHIDTDVTQP